MRISSVNHALFDLLERLDAARIHYMLGRHRAESILVSVTLVGQRIEIDVFRDGHLEISRFLGSEDIEGGTELVDDIIARATD
jgi:L-alanine-DL-glutamate epimerase-like enolase superfamily enzyme